MPMQQVATSTPKSFFQYTSFWRRNSRGTQPPYLRLRLLLVSTWGGDGVTTASTSSPPPPKSAQQKKRTFRKRSEAAYVNPTWSTQLAIRLARDYTPDLKKRQVRVLYRKTKLPPGQSMKFVNTLEKLVWLWASGVRVYNQNSLQMVSPCNYQRDVTTLSYSLCIRKKQNQESFGNLNHLPHPKFHSLKLVSALQHTKTKRPGKHTCATSEILPYQK
ncbi:hypothetical protein RUM44_009859 [Polyplax serrata]|uniref:Uncharacterized protein n=1 Tax=Polyplax serrata TaxID=468196 RepID=A0ABR1ATZ4_POLSC